MAREEIQRAADEYARKNWLCISLISAHASRDSFIAGAELAGRHPDTSSLWHPGDKIPKEDKGIIMENIYGDVSVYMFASQYYPLGFVKRWAYLEDILPKNQ